MVLKLYGSALSTARVLVAVIELELPYELVTVDIGKGEQYAEDYKKLQPFSKVPVLDDDGLVMFESRAICRYLVNKYGSSSGLVPDVHDHRNYARFEQACSVEQCYFAAAAEGIGTEVIIRPRKGLGPPDASRIAEAVQGLEDVLAYYDKILSAEKYLMGSDISLVDLFHLANTDALYKHGFEDVMERYPNVLRWFKDMTGRDSWTKTVAELGI
ncbi:Glutathione S-transferase-like protein 5 [Elsinoe fawcettii]|nr:Glutathione S-transferase-like protein 5 [Elsinoe fawcettii]